MKPIFKSPLWWGILLLALLCTLWSVSLIQSVARLQNEVSRNVTLIKMSWLVTVSCVLAIFSSIVLLIHQRDLARRRAAETAWREGEERFRRLAENAPDLIYRYRFAPAPGFEYVSPAATAMIGYTPEEHYADPNFGFKLVHPDDRAHLEAFKNAPPAEVMDLTLRWFHKDGKMIWTEQRLVPIADETGRIVAIEGVVRDVTRRKQAEQALRESEARFHGMADTAIEDSLRESEERFRSAFDYALSGMLLVDPNGRIVQANRALCGMLGYSETELLNLDIRAVTHPDDVSSTLEVSRRAIAGELNSYQYEKRYRRKDGRIVWAIVGGALVRDPEGKPRYFISHVQDITARKQAEEALRQSEERYRTLVERLSDGVYRSTPEGKFIEVNPAMVQMLGYASKDELMAIDIRKQLYFDEQERETVVHKLRRAGGDEIDVFRLRHKTGREIWVEDHGRLISDGAGKVIYHEGILRDISARRHTEEALRESEERYRSVIGALAEGVVLYDADGSIIASNASAERILGLSAAQLQGRHAADPQWRAIHEDGSPFPIVTHPAAISLDTGQSCANVVMGVHKPGGELAWISINSQPLLRPGETKPYAVVASFYDITESKWAEEALRESEERYRLLAENSLDLIELIDLDGNVMYASPSHYYVIGYTPNELVYQNLFSLVHHEDAPPALAAINGLRDSTTRKTIELRLQQKNGDWIAMEALLSGIPGPGNAVHRILFSARNITARKEAEEHLKGSLKEKEVLLKEIHHRVKNNLQIISSLLNLQSGYIQDKHAGEMFKESRNRVKSMALIHERLYQSKDLARIDFAEYVRNLTTHLFRSYGVNARAVGLKINVGKILLDIDTAIPCGLIINELVTNSLKYAFPPGVAGEIRIELRRENAGQLTLIVSDNGAGLPEDFDLQKADSLGLQLVNTLADQLEGRIQLERGGGTTFKIMLQPHHGLDSQGTSDGAQNCGTSFSR